VSGVAVDALVVGGSPTEWMELGLRVDAGHIALQGTGIRIDPSLPAGLHGWDLAPFDEGEPVSDSIDGLSTWVVDGSHQGPVDHAIGATSIDHVVISTDSIERTSAAIAEATGAVLKRIRELPTMRQGFHRIGSLVIELVELPTQPVGPATFWGLVLNVADLDAAVALLGPHRLGHVKDAVQPGRRIVTVSDAPQRRGLQLALMSEP